MLLARLPENVRRPAYDRAALCPGIAHLGVGAFHRCHQAEYTDDLLEQDFGAWGIVGINIRPPSLGPTLGEQGGLYTRLAREGGNVEARVIGSLLSVVDAQDNAAPALAVLASPEIDVVTLTVTEKGYCHRPADATLDLDHPDIVHDLVHPERPRSVPGLLARALEMRMLSASGPVTLLSCDNIPANGVLLRTVVRAMAERRGKSLADWIAANVAFPSAMVDRIAPAATMADRETVESEFGYRDEAAVACEPFRQWVIENRFAGRRPRWDFCGASFVEDVEPFEHLKMRVLNGAQTTLSYLGALAGHEHTCDDMRDPLLVRFVRRMLLEETLPTLAPVSGIVPKDYVEQSFGRLANTAIRHRNHQIATDGSQKIVQRILNPIRERLRQGQSIELLAVPVAGWMAYLILASKRFGARWGAEDPLAARVAAIADQVGNDPKGLAEAILAINSLFDAELAASPVLREAVAEGLAGFLGAKPMAYLAQVCEAPAGGRQGTRLKGDAGVDGSQSPPLRGRGPAGQRGSAEAARRLHGANPSATPSGLPPISPSRGGEG